MKFFILLFLLISFNGCISNNNIGQSEYKQQTVYLYVNKNKNPNKDLLINFENNILFAFKTKNLSIESINDPKLFNKSGLLLYIDSLQQRDGIRNEISVVYRIISNSPKITLDQNTIIEKSFFTGFINLTIPLSEALVDKVTVASKKLTVEKLKQIYQPVSIKNNQKKSVRIFLN